MVDISVLPTPNRQKLNSLQYCQNPHLIQMCMHIFILHLPFTMMSSMIPPSH